MLRNKARTTHFGLADRSGEPLIYNAFMRCGEDIMYPAVCLSIARISKGACMKA